MTPIFDEWTKHYPTDLRSGWKTSTFSFWKMTLREASLPLSGMKQNPASRNKLYGPLTSQTPQPRAGCFSVHPCTQAEIKRTQREKNGQNAEKGSWNCLRDAPLNILTTFHFSCSMFSGSFFARLWKPTPQTSPKTLNKSSELLSKYWEGHKKQKRLSERAQRERNADKSKYHETIQKTPLSIFWQHFIFLVQRFRASFGIFLHARAANQHLKLPTSWLRRIAQFLSSSPPSNTFCRSQRITGRVVQHEKVLDCSRAGIDLHGNVLSFHGSNLNDALWFREARASLIKR